MKTALKNLLAIAAILAATEIFAVELGEGWNFVSAGGDIYRSAAERDGILQILVFKNGKWEKRYPSEITIIAKKGEVMAIHSDRRIAYSLFPKIGSAWYWQLDENLNTEAEAEIYDVDLFDTAEDTIRELKNGGKYVVCYFSAGTYEEWRPDADEFPESALGRKVDGWEGERWLNIKDPKVMRIMKKRIDLAYTKGCDAVEPDNVDGYDNPTGFSLNYEDQLRYNKLLAKKAHKTGLAIGLKNDIGQTKDLASVFDFAINEECHEYEECEEYGYFIKKGKAVLNAEYGRLRENICKESEKIGISTSFFGKKLDGKRFTSCLP